MLMVLQAFALTALSAALVLRPTALDSSRKELSCRWSRSSAQRKAARVSPEPGKNLTQIFDLRGANRLSEALRPPKPN
ncbi:hypothetical protein CIK76_08785 [Glutamicibacter sp. BW80]|nr:hypothetical protein CIK76_08785 [Glutamicibacter sp. BW80]